MKSPNKDIIYQGNTVISIEKLPDYPHPVIVKKPSKKHTSPHHIQSLGKEYQMIRALGKVKGIRKALDQKSIENQQVLHLEYIDGETLRNYNARKKLRLRTKLKIAVDLVHILSEIHQKNIIHLDLNSTNILIGSKKRTVHLIDLGSTSLIDRSGHQKVLPEQMLGILTHISPEQTGRINRTVDERSDLYSLGVVLYELMTGQLPFDSKDPMELVHNHIARTPVSPSQVSPQIPGLISAIILNLLRKNAEDRYQSAVGVQADLEKCLQHLSPDDTIEEFPLGESDYATSLRFPQKLYGRDRELKELENAFESICRDTSSIVFVGGYPGIGKTALVEGIQRLVSEKSGYFIRGKFDQFVTTPYEGISQALIRFVSQILTQTETQLAAWRSKILEAVGPNGRVLTNFVPSLELVIGPQPVVPDLSGQEAQNRFNYVFQRFFGAIARREHPICFFLDDLQWVDPSSLERLKNLFSSPDLAHLLIVGAYRDNEVDETHPLMALIADLEKAGVNLKQITLKELSEADVEALISDTLRRDAGEVRELSRLVYSQTDGNPFFTRQVLRSLDDQGLIALDTATGQWRWDMDSLRDMDVVDSVVELLVSKLKELPVDIQETLKAAAYFGNQFDIGTLTVVTERDGDAILDHVQEAVAAGLIWERENRGFFVHDRVQEAAYALVPPEDRDRIHLTIGRLLWQRHLASDHDQDLFQIVDQLNHGLHLIDDEQEQVQLARLYLQAGRKAKHSSAFSAFAEYMKRSASLLAEEAWRGQYPLMLDIYNEWIQSCFLSIQYQEVEILFGKILEHGKQAADFYIAYKTMIQMKKGKNEFNEAISIAEGFLERLQISFDPALEYKLSIDDLYNLPVMKDKEKLAAMEILTEISTTVIMAAPERFPSVVFTMLNLINRYGNSSMSSFAYSEYAMILCLMQRYEEGNRFGQLAIDLLEKYPYPGRGAEIMNMQYANVRHWIQPIHDQITPLKTHHRMAMQAGSFEFGLYCLLNYTLLLWGSGKPLEHCLAEVEPSISLCQIMNQQFSLLMALMLAQSVLNLTGRSPSTTQLEGKWFSEETMMSRLEGSQFLLATYGLLKMKLCYLFGDPAAAYRQAQDVLKYRGSVNPHYLYTKISFYGALSCIAGLPDGENDADRQERIERLATFKNELKLWANVGPMNYQHQYDLVIAEECRTSNKQWEAVQLYEQAIRGAQENQFVHDQALANELFAQFWLEQGYNTIAEMYMREAHALYHQWGADAKVSHLEKLYPEWFQAKTTITGKPETTTQPITPIQLDMESLISTSQLLSAETDLEQLISKMMTLVMANSGAEKAVLLLKQENDWFVQARGDVSTEKHDILLNLPFHPDESEAGFIPEPVFNYCKRSKEVLVVGDAQLDDRFAKDKSIQKQYVKSMACIPILSRGELNAMMYLENRQMADVFSPERIEIIKNISSQFGISVENALLYESINLKVQELRKSEELLSQIYDSTADILFYIEVKPDDCFHFVSVNQSFLEATGLTREQIIGKRIEEVIPEPSVWMVLDNYKKAIKENRIVRWEETSDYPSGTKIGEVSIAPVLNEKGICTHLVGSVHDLTERKEAEEKILSEKDKLLTAIDSSVDIIGITDLEGNLRTVNKSFSRITGFERKEVIGKKLTKVQSKKDAPKALNAFKDIIEKGVCSTFELDFLSKDGRTINTLASGVLLRDERGKPSEVFLMAKDITERKETQKRLEESERKYRELVEDINDAIYFIDAKSKVVYISPAVKSIVGYEPHELIGKHFSDFVYSEDLKKMKKGMESALGGKTTPADYRIVNKAGSHIWIRALSKVVKDDNNNILGIRGVISDITERKQVEQELKKSEHDKSIILNSTNEIIAFHDLDHNFKWVNKAYLDAVGFSKSEVMGRKCYHAWGLDRLCTNCPVSIALKTGEPFEAELTPQNQEHWPPDQGSWSVRAAPVKDDDGNVIGAIEVAHDITARKQAEEEAHRQREALARVDRATSMGQLTGSISHELNQPLTGILSSAQAAELMIKKGLRDPNELEEIMTEIIADAKRAGDMIRNLRELYREQKGEYLPVDINAAIKETIQLFHSEFVAHHVVLKTECMPSLPKVTGNRIQVEQVLVNLIMNGIQAMRGKARDDRRLQIATVFDANEVKVWVEDSGTGIDADKIDHIFKPLATWKTGGIGMGLAVSNSIIEAHGGKMWAENRPEGGARVGFVIPVIKESKKV